MIAYGRVPTSRAGRERDSEPGKRLWRHLGYILGLQGLNFVWMLGGVMYDTSSVECTPAVLLVLFLYGFALVALWHEPRTAAFVDHAHSATAICSCIVGVGAMLFARNGLITYQELSFDQRRALGVRSDLDFYYGPTALTAAECLTASLPCWEWNFVFLTQVACAVVFRAVVYFGLQQTDATYRARAQLADYDDQVEGSPNDAKPLPPTYTR